MAKFAELNVNELNDTNGGSVSLPVFPIKVAIKIAAATSVAYTVYKAITK